jgi:integrase
MSRSINRLTERTVRSVKPGLYPDGGGLYLQVTPGADDALRHSWLYRFATTDAERVANPQLGRERRMGLGAYPAVGLAEARQRAAEARRMREQGIDPINQRDMQKAAQVAAANKVVTFDQCAEGFLADHAEGWVPKHAHDYARSLTTHVSPVFGSLPVGMVDTTLVLKVLRPIWRTRTHLARVLRERIECVLDWSIASHHREGPNPARWKGHLNKILGKQDHIVQHHAALPYAEISSLVAELRARDDRDARCLELLILTATRVDAAAGARAEEFDLVHRIWTVPASRMKRRGKRKKLPFRIPLSDAVIRVIERVGVKAGRLFPGATHKTLGRAHGRADVTVHGFRSGFRDWAGECTGYASEVIEMAMSHVAKGETEEAYFRSDLLLKRAAVMQAWADFCSRPAITGDTVVPIRKGELGVG